MARMYSLKGAPVQLQHAPAPRPRTVACQAAKRELGLGTRLASGAVMLAAAAFMGTSAPAAMADLRDFEVCSVGRGPLPL